MIQPTSGYNAFSASTELWLEAAQRRIELAQIGPDFIMARDSAILPRGAVGALHATTGHHETVWQVQLPEGMDEHHSQTRIVVLDEPPF